MYKNLLIATDGSELATKALEQGLGLAKALGAKVTIVTVTEPWTAAVSGEMAIAFPIEDYEKGCVASAERVLSAASEVAGKVGVAFETRHVKDQFPAEGIVEAAKANGADLIVMASHGRRGMTRLLLGSQANKVVTHSTVPVLICR
jgi:nucleotide-binding universal stress UspA family protein